ncbi:MAG: 5-formyltetrahydrofolate cyclo-ligase [Cellulophaga sp.]|uniref:5-formyltetrahydrofolate cyclo-ligase n=1 Tax=unclassified Cellulophaga TaxID=2634405 RepID=UPI000C2B6458|nr:MULTISPECIES: 5-formyltetrahydrofolate cyclo-ligase [unclassified Cellulophaga]MDO6491117.1 5-formyltetrahydrofolate cyclo-ligase [Cellulophaga sp. 2_MG-2023]MDO6495350.1 5-formyltetrahydrofolate cyclo-ligase [Cellulophaga sp. 3_MG-2023]PKB42916.1 5-formyltetrahydrofolate cyclo-ligase [Cellulophaga sp. RHA19]
MIKKELRAKYVLLRDKLSKEDAEDKSIEIANQLLKLPIWDYSYYHIFLSIEEKKEIDTGSILAILQGKDKNVILPKMNADNTLTNYLLTDSTIIKKNSYNVPEPVDGIDILPNKIDVVFVPLLAFDKKGNRIGYGKGFYDAFLSECKPNVLKIGLSFFEAEDVITDVYKDDVPLDYCVTPLQIYQF